MEANIQKLCQAFLDSNSPNRDIRNAGSLLLVQAQQTPGYSAVAFQILTNEQIPPNVRLAAALSFKNIAVERWAPRVPNVVPIAEEEKVFIRAHYINAVTYSSVGIRNALETPLKEILLADFPTKWPDFAGQAVAFLQSNDTKKIMGALVCFRYLLRAFEWVTLKDPRRVVLNQAVESLFPLLFSLFQYLLTLEQQDSWDMQLLLIKTFYSGTQFIVPPYFTQDTSRFQAWMETLYKVFLKPEPAGIDTTDEFKRGKHVTWRIKRWIGHTWVRFMDRYGKARKKDLPENISFGHYFVPTYSAKLIETVLAVLTWKTQGVFIPPRLEVLMMAFLNTTMMYGSTFPMIAGYIEGLFRSILFPALYLQPSDWNIYINEPEEFIRILYDPVEELHDIATAAVSFIKDYIKYRRKDFLGYALNFLATEALPQYYAAPPDQRNHRHKYACMSLFTALHDEVVADETLAEVPAQFLATHVFPEFASPLPFLQSKALACFNAYFNAKFPNAQLMYNGVDGVIQLLRSQQLVVRFEAALALSSFAHQKVVKPLIAPIVTEVMKVFFDLVDTVDNEDLLGAVQVMIVNYQEQMAPFAVQIVTQLAGHFHRLVDGFAANHHDDDGEDDGGILAAIQLWKSINTVLEACSKTPTIYVQMEPILLPTMLQVFKSSGSDFMDDIIHTLSYLTYYGEITENVWSLYPFAIHALLTFAADYTSELLGPLDNYISRSTEKFFQGDRLQLVCSLFERFIGNPKIAEFDAANICKLVEVLLIYGQGRIDALVPTIMQLCITRLASAKKPELKAHLFMVLTCAMFYNPGLAIAVLQQTNQTTPILQQIYAQLVARKKKDKIFTTLHMKRVVCIGITSLLQLSVANMPFSALVRDLVIALVGFIQVWETQREGEEGDSDAEEGAESEEEDEEDEEEEEEEEDGEDDEVEPAAPKPVLGLNTDGTFSTHADVDHGDDENYDHLLKLAEQEEEYDDEEDQEWSSKIDEIDPIVYFCEVFQAFSIREGAQAQQLIQSLPQETSQTLNEFAQTGQRRQARKILKAQTAAAAGTPM